MAVQDTTGIAATRRPADWGRYDLVLAAIPLAFAFGAVIAAAAGLPLGVGIGAGGVLAVATTAYALFGVPPTDGRVPPRGAGGS